MQMGKTVKLLDSLETAKGELIHLSQSSGVLGDWDAAERYLRLARELDGVLANVKQGEERNGRSSQNGSVSASADRLPRYSREGRKLLKVGRARDGEGIYKHRVTFENYTAMIGHLKAMAGQETFETVELIRRCGLPAHEPRIVLDVLEERGLLTSPRKGRWTYANPAKFATDVEEVWPNLPLE